MALNFHAGVVAVGIALAGLAAAAEPPRLAWPVDCRLGEDCWLMNYADTAPGPRARDFRCGPLAYDGHKGTDIAIRDQAGIARGYTVRAAAAGTVTGVRDRLPDHQGTAADRRAAQATGEECGNGLVIAHGEGWETQYCHLRQGSISVGAGDTVAAGDPLGAVGQTGFSQHPHLHLSVRKDGQAYDPFTALPIPSGCETPAQGTLWRDDVQAFLPAEAEPMLFAAGFADGPADYQALLADAASPATLSARAPALVLWGLAFGVAKDDVYTFRIVDERGETVFRNTSVAAKTQARAMQFSGRRNSGWLRPGTYTGVVRLIRNRNGAPPLISAQTVPLRVVE